MNLSQPFPILNQLTRVSNDPSCIDQQSIQNIAAGNYILSNPFLQYNYMSHVQKLATSQVGINYKGGFGLSSDPNDVDCGTRMRFGYMNTNPRSRVDLFTRPFVTVPYLGRGDADAVVEAQLQQGVLVKDPRTILRDSEKNMFKYSSTPLIPLVASQLGIQDSSKMIEQFAEPSFIRGGISTRDLHRDTQSGLFNNR